MLKAVGCGAVSLSVAWFVVIGLLSSSRASHHRHAATSLKTISTAEADFRMNDRDGNRISDFWVGDVAALWYMKAGGVPIELIERSVANADGAPLKPLSDARAKAGYLYRAIPKDEDGKPYDEGNGRNTSKFAFCCYPEEYRPKAWYRDDLSVTTLTFIINEDGVIWKKDTGAAPVTKWPKDLWGEGWSKLD